MTRYTISITLQAQSGPATTPIIHEEDVVVLEESRERFYVTHMTQSIWAFGNTLFAALGNYAAVRLGGQEQDAHAQPTPGTNPEP